MNITGQELKELFTSYGNSPMCNDHSCQLCVLKKAIESLEFSAILNRYLLVYTQLNPLEFTKLVLANGIAIGIVKVETSLLEGMMK